MILSTEQLLSVAQGWLRYEVRDGFLCLHRFTPEQEAVNAAHGQALKNGTTAGIRLELRTAARQLHLEYRILPGGTRPYYGFDVSVDGLPVHSVFEQTDRAEGVLEAALGPGEKRVTVYLPNVCECHLRNLSLDAPFTPVRRPRRILMTGDSITQGCDARHPALCYANLVADALDAELLNQGIANDRFFPECVDAAMDWPTDLVTVAYGTNDWGTGSDVPATADAYFAKLRRVYACPIYAILPIWRRTIDGADVSNAAGVTLEQVREQIRTAARRHGVAVIEAGTFFPQAADYYHDGALHPNDLGFIWMARGIVAALREKQGVQV